MRPTLKIPDKPELLAPAGNWDSLVAAVENGADAVYLGGELFSARQSAGNFSDRELVEAIEYARVRQVKIYVAVNTLIEDRELPEALRFLHFLQQAGADAAIVQDLGLVRLARQAIPELSLHASTQMTVHNLPAALTLKKLGIERIILARELSLKSILNIIRQGNVEVEVFVHGALCVSYSGQCLMSSMVGGRSGNRGRCAQPCRLPYTLTDRHGKVLADPDEAGEYLLSPRDLNLSQHLPEIILAGITSLKIEGRMRRPEYVATVVRIYRELIDRAAAGGEFAVSPDEQRELAQIFNRGFTSGYLAGPPGPDFINWKRPNNRGIRLGRIRDYDWHNRLAAVLLEEPLRSGDEIEVWVSEGGRVSLSVDNIILDGHEVTRAPAGRVVQLKVPGRVKRSDRVFKIHDADLIERARESFISPRKLRKTPVFFTVTAKAGEPLVIRVQDDKGLAGEAATASPAQVAVSKPLNAKYLSGQLGRLGNTPYALAGLACRFDGDLIVPVSEINEARRRALSKLGDKRAAAGRKDPVTQLVFDRRLTMALPSAPEPPPAPLAGNLPVLAAAVGDLPSLEAAVNAGAGEVYLGGDCYRSREPLTEEDIITGSEICAANGVGFVLCAARICNDNDLTSFYRLLDRLASAHLDAVLLGNLGLLDRAGEISGRPVYTDFSLNIFNRAAACALQAEGVARVTLSSELTLGQVTRLVPGLPLQAEVIVHGALPLMVSEYCVAGSLLAGAVPSECPGLCRGRFFELNDRLGVRFPVEMDRNCRMHVFNSRDLCVIDDVEAIAGAGVAVLRVEARREGAAYVRDVVKAYRRVLHALPEGLPEQELRRLKDALAVHSSQGFTKGHFFRGVV